MTQMPVTICGPVFQFSYVIYSSLEQTQGSINMRNSFSAETTTRVFSTTLKLCEAV